MSKLSSGEMTFSEFHKTRNSSQEANIRKGNKQTKANVSQTGFICGSRKAITLPRQPCLPLFTPQQLNLMINKTRDFPVLRLLLHHRQRRLKFSVFKIAFKAISCPYSFTSSLSPLQSLFFNQILTKSSKYAIFSYTFSHDVSLSEEPLIPSCVLTLLTVWLPIL